MNKARFVTYHKSIHWKRGLSSRIVSYLVDCVDVAREVAPCGGSAGGYNLTKPSCPCWPTFGIITALEREEMCHAYCNER